MEILGQDPQPANSSAPAQPSADPVTKLRELTQFSILDCKRALMSCNNDVEQARRWLAYGNWMGSKLISWDYEALRTKAERLASNLDIAVSRCYEAVQQCGGNESLARDRLLGLL